jgi:hypothetical protein
MTQTGVQAVFPSVPLRAGMYESFYLRAVSPHEPVGAWIRYTVHKRPGHTPRGSLWCTVFDAARGQPYMHKLTTDALSTPANGWIAVGDAALGPERAEGVCGEARWSLRFASSEPELRHLPRALLYRTPLPRTKLTSPAPAARFEGTIELDNRTIDVGGWSGMVGHNWGSEHAERWIWLHGVDFQEAAGSIESTPRGLGKASPAWLDVAIGRLLIAGRTSPWVANGVLSLDGERHRLGGLATDRRSASGLLVAETPERCRLSLPGPGGLMVEAHVRTPPGTHAGWRYADPDGSEHDVSNCSIAALTLVARRPGLPARTLRTAHGAAYELGMRERDHGVPIAPFPDG